MFETDITCVFGIEYQVMLSRKKEIEKQQQVDKQVLTYY